MSKRQGTPVTKEVVSINGLNPVVQEVTEKVSAKGKNRKIVTAKRPSRKADETKDHDREESNVAQEPPTKTDNANFIEEEVSSARKESSPVKSLVVKVKEHPKDDRNGSNNITTHETTSGTEDAGDATATNNTTLNVGSTGQYQPPRVSKPDPPGFHLYSLDTTHDNDRIVALSGLSTNEVNLLVQGGISEIDQLTSLDLDDIKTLLPNASIAKHKNLYQIGLYIVSGRKIEVNTTMAAINAFLSARKGY